MWGAIGTIFSIVITVMNIALILAIKINEIKHLSKESDRHSRHIGDLYEKLDLANQRIARLEGKTNGQSSH